MIFTHLSLKERSSLTAGITFRLKSRIKASLFYGVVKKGFKRLANASTVSTPEYPIGYFTEKSLIVSNSTHAPRQVSETCAKDALTFDPLLAS